MVPDPLPEAEGSCWFFVAGDNARGSSTALYKVEGKFMSGSPNTVGLILLFAVIFLACILWATHGHTATTDSEEEDVGTPGKTS